MAAPTRALDGMHAVVTGGSRGIGAAVASALAGAGARITLMARSADDLSKEGDSIRRAHSVDVGEVECDVTDLESVRVGFAQAVTKLGPVHILVNNAGGAESALFADTTPAIWEKMIALNLTSVYACSSEVLPAMIKAGRGRIVNVASTAALRGYKTMTAYCAAKHGVLGFTRALALETAKRGVTVNAVCPGYTDTEIFESAVSNIVSALGKTEDEARQMLIRTNPSGKLVQPEEVAAAVLWLCLPEASAVTGIALPIAGGEVS